MSRTVRRLSFSHRRLLADTMEKEAVDGVLMVPTIIAFTKRMAHEMGMDSSELSTDSVTRLADEIGITLRSTDASQKMRSTVLLGRINELESRHADLVKQHEALSAVHNTVARNVGELLNRVDELERLYVEVTGNVVTVTPENAKDIARVAHAIAEKRHDKHR